MTPRAPALIAIVLLLLLVVYVGSYVALVVPEGEVVREGWACSSNGCTVMTTFGSGNTSGDFSGESRMAAWNRTLTNRRECPSR